MKLLKKEWLGLYKFMDGLTPKDVGDRVHNTRLNSALLKIYRVTQNELEELAKLQFEFDHTTNRYKQRLVNAQMALKSSPTDEKLLNEQRSAADLLNHSQSSLLLAVENIFLRDNVSEEIEVKFSKDECNELKNQFDTHGTRLPNRQLYVALSGMLV